MNVAHSLLAEGSGSKGGKELSLQALPVALSSDDAVVTAHSVGKRRGYRDRDIGPKTPGDGDFQEGRAFFLQMATPEASYGKRPCPSYGSPYIQWKDQSKSFSRAVRFNHECSLTYA